MDQHALTTDRSAGLLPSTAISFSATAGSCSRADAIEAPWPGTLRHVYDDSMPCIVLVFVHSRVYAALLLRGLHILGCCGCSYTRLRVRYDTICRALPADQIAIIDMQFDARTACSVKPDIAASCWGKQVQCAGELIKAVL